MLTKEQEAIVHAKDQHMLVVAGAGTGKTHTMIERVKNLLYNEKIPAHEILMTSFSRTANSELYEKAINKIGSQADNLCIGTIHALCYKIVNENIDLFGLSKIEIAGMGYFAKIIFNIDPSRFKNTREASQIAHVYKAIRMNGTELYNIDNVDLQNCIEAEKIMLAKGKFTYDDLLFHGKAILEKYPKVRSKWQKFKHVIIDEGQDTSKIQWEIIELLLKDDTHTCVIGDVKQNIYGFRGASFIYMNAFREKRNSAVYTLSETFRFGQHIADLSNKVIDEMDIEDIYKKKTTTNVKINNKPEFHLLPIEEEPEFIVNKIKEYVSKGFQYKDNHVLYRFNKNANALMRELLKENIPFETKSGDIFEKKEIKFVLNALHLIDNFTIADLIEFSKQYSNFVGDFTLTSVYNHWSNKTNKLFDFMNYCKNCSIAGLGPVKKKNLKELAQVFESLKSYLDKYTTSKANIRSIAQILNMDDTKFMKDKDDSVDPDDKASNKWDFIDFFQELYEEDEFISIIDWYNHASLNTFESKKDKNKVQLKTIHGSKGQSLPIVFLLASQIGTKPFPGAMEEDEILDELFLFYVALTRVEKHFHFLMHTSARESFRFKFVFPTEWLNSEEINRLEFVISELEYNFMNYKREYTSKIKSSAAMTNYTEKAVQFSVGEELVWIPISCCGFNAIEGRFYMKDWFKKKQVLQRICD